MFFCPMARLSWPDFHYRQRYMNTSKEDRFILDYSSRGLRLWALDAAVSALWRGRKDLQEQSFLSHGPCKAKRKTQRAQGQAVAFKDMPASKWVTSFQQALPLSNSFSNDPCLSIWLLSEEQACNTHKPFKEWCFIFRSQQGHVLFILIPYGN